MAADIFGYRAGVDWEPIATSDCPWPACLYAVLDYDEEKKESVVIGCRMTMLGFNCPHKPAKLMNVPKKSPIVLNIAPNVNVTIKLEHGNLCPQDCVHIEESVHDGVYKGLNELVDDLANVLAKDGAH